MRKAWILASISLLATIGAALVAGLAFGYPALWVIAALTVYLGWNCHSSMVNRQLALRSLP